MTREKEYNIVCEWLLQQEKIEALNLSAEELERLEWHKNRMEESLDFLNANPTHWKRSLYETDFSVSFREIKMILNK